MAHGVIRTDLMSGTDVGYDLVSVKFVNEDVPAEIDNGNVVKLDSLNYEDQREVWKGVAPAKDTPVEDIAIIASVEVVYDETLATSNNLDKFYNEADKICRGYRPHGIYSATADAFTIADGYTPAVGAIVELNGTVKPAIVATATAGNTKIGTLVAIEDAGRYTYYVVQCSPKA